MSEEKSELGLNVIEKIMHDYENGEVDADTAVRHMAATASTAVDVADGIRQTNNALRDYLKSLELELRDLNVRLVVRDSDMEDVAQSLGLGVNGGDVE